MNPVYMIGGLRTPIGKTDGFLKDLLPEQLASIILNEIVHKYRLSPNDIDQVILGNAVGPGGNIARVSVLAASWPYSIPAITVDTQCGSGLSAINWAVSQIQSGQTELVLAGGVESTSLAPRRQFNPADPRFQGEHVYYERAPFSTPAVGDPEIGDAAEYLAESLSISREDMDALALESHRRASMTKEKKIFKDIIVPIETAGKHVDSDECIRNRMSLKLLERMQPVFKAEGKITAGNTCLKHDGAAIILLASSNALKKYNLKPQAMITGTASCGCDPNLFPLGPIAPIQKLLHQSNLRMKDIDALEINEAFAVKILACCRQLDFSLDKTNMLGGALAYGHPYGASGAIILLHLVKALQQVNGHHGIAAIGAVGGMGIATLIERC
ncbi:thiolase family protein [Pelosinus propionicus]|uniref:acetyl-CoA C-acetyltransferase n=1 Tax=Pelosinus propionicus DSM 13327 TaxID=1123291 RepID=A0A1I4MJN8_9FIRM|nr:thiolase family protein [Pelosinus propionicus]SFM03290.1 acetyl-CoA C-acetyltransferase [Pelosinus propionicus DSM 13327]